MRIRFRFVALFAVLVILAIAAPAQAPQTPRFIAGHTYSLTASPAYFTLQLPANSPKRIYLIAASVECQEACTVAQDMNGNAAETDEITATRISGATFTPTLDVYAPSNAGFGANLSTLTVPAETPYPLDLSSVTLEQLKSTVQTYNIRTSAVTGTARIYVIWAEQ